MRPGGRSIGPMNRTEPKAEKKAPTEFMRIGNGDQFTIEDGGETVYEKINDGEAKVAAAPKQPGIVGSPWRFGRTKPVTVTKPADLGKVVGSAKIEVHRDTRSLRPYDPARDPQMYGNAQPHRATVQVEVELTDKGLGRARVVSDVPALDPQSGEEIHGDPLFYRGQVVAITDEEAKLVRRAAVAA
jgi:hypothetical protein